MYNTPEVRPVLALVYIEDETDLHNFELAAFDGRYLYLYSSLGVRAIIIPYIYIYIKAKVVFITLIYFTLHIVRYHISIHVPYFFTPINWHSRERDVSNLIYGGRKLTTKL